MPDEPVATFAVPLHIQLKNTLTDQIITGMLPVHARIPSERELCQQYKVSRTTTRRTLSTLIYEGWLYTVVGKGTYVARNPLEQELQPVTGFAADLRHRGIEVASHVLSAENIKATDAIAHRLSLLPQTPVFGLSRLRMASGCPVAVQMAYLPEHLCPNLFQFDFVERSLYDVLRENYGLRLTQAHTTIKAALATAAEYQLLEMKPPAPVLRTYQITQLDDGQVVEYCESVFHGDRYELTSTAWTDGISTADSVGGERSGFID